MNNHSTLETVDVNMKEDSELEDIYSKIEEIKLEVDQCEIKLKEERTSFLFNKLDAPQKWVVLIIHIFVIGSAYNFLDKYLWLIFVIPLLFFVFAFTDGILEEVFKPNKKIEDEIKVKNDEINVLQGKLISIVDHKLMPEIQSLGMATIDNIMNKTIACQVPRDFIINLMNMEVEKGKFEKILLKSKDNILYKCKVPHFQGNIETVFLEID